MSLPDPDLERGRALLADDPSIILGPGPVFVRWRPNVAAAVPALRQAVADFDPGEREAAQACAAWLREHGLDEPQESIPYLMLDRGALLGFYALANGSTELRVRQREELGVQRRTQPAAIITQLARAADHPGVGQRLLQHAAVTARRLSVYSAATVLALDPFDDETAEMWKERFGFQESAGQDPGGKRPRLFVPLR